MMRLVENVQSSRKYRRLTCAWREYGYFSLRRSQSDDIFPQSIPHIHHPQKEGSLKPLRVCYLFINPVRAICHHNYQKPQLLYNDEYFMSPSCVNLFRVVFGRNSTVFAVCFFFFFFSAPVINFKSYKAQALSPHVWIIKLWFSVGSTDICERSHSFEWCPIGIVFICWNQAARLQPPTKSTLYFIFISLCCLKFLLYFEWPLWVQKFACDAIAPGGKICWEKAWFYLPRFSLCEHMKKPSLWAGGWRFFFFRNYLSNTAFTYL